MEARSALLLACALLVCLCTAAAASNEVEPVTPLKVVPIALRGGSDSEASVGTDAERSADEELVAKFAKAKLRRSKRDKAIERFSLWVSRHEGELMSQKPLPVNAVDEGVKLASQRKKALLRYLRRRDTQTLLMLASNVPPELRMVLPEAVREHLEVPFRGLVTGYNVLCMKRIENGKPVSPGRCHPGIHVGLPDGAMSPNATERAGALREVFDGLVITKMGPASHEISPEEFRNHLRNSRARLSRNKHKVASSSHHEGERPKGEQAPPMRGARRLDDSSSDASEPGGDRGAELKTPSHFGKMRTFARQDSSWVRVYGPGMPHLFRAFRTGKAAYATGFLFSGDAGGVLVATTNRAHSDTLAQIQKAVTQAGPL